MIRNYHTLWRWTAENGPRLAEARIVEVFSQERDRLHVGFITPRRDSVWLEISADPALPYVVLRAGFKRKRKNSVDLFAQICGLKVQDVRMHPADRVLFVTFQNGSRLVVELFGSINIFGVDAQGVITAAFKDNGESTGKTYAEPSRPPLPDSLEGYTAQVASVDELKTQLTRGLFHFNKYLAIEFLRHVHAAEATVPGSFEIFRAFIHRLRHEAPRIYHVDGAPQLFSLIDLAHFKEAQGAAGHAVHEVMFPNVNDALERFVGEKHQYEWRARRHGEVLRACRNRLRKIQALVIQLQKERAQAGRHERHEQLAHLLTIHLAEIHRGMSRITVEDVYADPPSQVAIDLDPALTPQRNVDAFFAAARKMKQSVRKIEGRIRAVQKEVGELTDLEASLRDPATVDWKRVESTHRLFSEKGWISRRPTEAGSAKTERPEVRFREFIVMGNWHVLVGQNDAKNDLLTFKVAKKNDLWFHARGVPGSHVVLRTVGRTDRPGRRVLEHTASIAAFYSKARTSGLVPVSYTERKYVRKPKGSPSGQVMLEREEVIIVPPVDPGQIGIDNDELFA